MVRHGISAFVCGLTLLVVLACGGGDFEPDPGPSAEVSIGKVGGTTGSAGAEAASPDMPNGSVEEEQKGSDAEEAPAEPPKDPNEPVCCYLMVPESETAPIFTEHMARHKRGACIEKSGFEVTDDRCPPEVDAEAE